MPGEAQGSSNYIPITPIVVDELQKAEYEQGNYMAIGDLIEKEAGRLARIVDRGNKELHRLLTFLIREILRNTPCFIRAIKSSFDVAFLHTFLNHYGSIKNIAFNFALFRFFVRAGTCSWNRM